MDIIDCFDGPYAFLSNFYPATVEFDGERYNTVEAAYQAAKTVHLNERYIIQQAATPGKAKRLGRKVTLRSNWELIKIDVMLYLLRKKFSIPHLRDCLLSTEDAVLVEGNMHGDMFWGQVSGVGRNELGKLLMHVRKELRTGVELAYTVKS